MLRTFLYSLAVLAFATVTVARADDAKSNDKKDNKDTQSATIAKLDAENGTLEVWMKNDDGKRVEKTLHLAKDASYLNRNGKQAKADDFRHGDRVCLTEKDGKVTQLKKEQAEARITKVDAEHGKITVQMRDEKGKSVEKEYTLIEDAEYIDSTGTVATIDVFRSGDNVLVIESEGQIKQMQQTPKQQKTAGKEDTSKQNKNEKNKDNK